MTPTLFWTAPIADYIALGRIIRAVSSLLWCVVWGSYIGGLARRLSRIAPALSDRLDTLTGRIADLDLRYHCGTGAALTVILRKR
jgi:hypothetical protein